MDRQFQGIEPEGQSVKRLESDLVRWDGCRALFGTRPSVVGYRSRAFCRFSL